MQAATFIASRRLQSPRALTHVTKYFICFINTRSPKRVFNECGWKWCANFGCQRRCSPGTTTRAYGDGRPFKLQGHG